MTDSDNDTEAECVRVSARTRTQYSPEEPEWDPLKFKVHMMVREYFAAADKEYESEN